jgi:hypothetical protein
VWFPVALGTARAEGRCLGAVRKPASLVAVKDEKDEAEKMIDGGEKKFMSAADLAAPIKCVQEKWKLLPSFLKVRRPPRPFGCRKKHAH